MASTRRPCCSFVPSFHAGSASTHGQTGPSGRGAPLTHPSPCFKVVVGVAMGLPFGDILRSAFCRLAPLWDPQQQTATRLADPAFLGTAWVSLRPLLVLPFR